MRQIAEQSGLSPSSVYYYFGSKDEILEAIVAEVNRVSLDRLAAINADGGEPAVRLFRLIRFDVEVLCRLPYDINEISRLAALQEERFATFWKERQQLNDEVEELVAAGIADGSLLEVDPRLAALSILADDEAVQNWFRPVGEHHLRGRDDPATGDYAPEEIGEFLATQTLGALLRHRSSLARVRREADRLDAAD